MAEENQKPASEAPASTEEVVVEKPITEKEPSVPEPGVEAPEKKGPVEELEEAEKPKAEEEIKPKAVEVEVKIAQSISFKEETYVVGELPEPQRKGLEELKQLVQEALNKHEFTDPPPPPPKAKEEEKKEEETAPAEVPAKTEEPPIVESEETVPAPIAEAKDEEPPKVETSESITAPPPVEKKEEVATEVAAPETVIEKTPPVEAKEEEKFQAAPSTEEVSEKVVEKVTATNEDGANTVEAIKETIVVEVSAPPAASKGEEPPSEPKAKESEEPKEEVPALPPPPPEEVSIWGIPLLQDERSDVILLKFLRARDFKVKDAFTMLKNTVRWRKEFGIDALLEEDYGNDWDEVVFTHGYDKEGHPVCYNVFSEFQRKDLYQNTFANEEKRQKFLRWRIQFLEKSIRNLDFSPTGISTIVQVNDFKNFFGLGKRELWQATNQAVQLFQDNYPEFLAKQVFINVPWWYLAYNRVISPFLTQRTKSKFVFALPSKSAETLFKYIAPEHVPVQYGGLKKSEEQEFTHADPVTEVAIKPATKHTIELPISEGDLLVWEVRVVGWEVSYGAEFVPSAEGAYTVIVQKTRKISPADETVISNSFRGGEQGKVVLHFDNQSSKKKKLLYRSKTKPSSD